MTSKQPVVDPLLLNERQAAKSLAISERMLSKQRKAGRVPFVRIGRRVAYSIEALRRWISEQEALT